jgi:hypothetical protein
MRAAPESFDLFLHFLSEIIAGPVIKSHIRAFAREHFAQGRANSSRAPGNKRALSF